MTEALSPLGAPSGGVFGVIDLFDAVRAGILQEPLIIPKELPKEST